MDTCLRPLASLRPGDHACHLYQSAAERRAVALRFIRDGLERGERVLCIQEAGPRQEVLDALGAEPLAAGQLVFGDPSQYGQLKPNRLVASLQQAFREAVQAGYSVLRILGDPAGHLSDPSLAGPLVEYESRCTGAFAEAAILALCQYDQRRVPPEILDAALDTHRLVVLGEELVENPFYLEPEVLLAPDRTARQLERRLKALRMQQEQERLRARHARQRSLLGAVFDGSPVAMLVVDAEARVQQVSGSVAQLAGRSAVQPRGQAMGAVLRCLHHLQSPQGCGQSPVCPQCPLRAAVGETFRTGQAQAQVEARLMLGPAEQPREVALLLYSTPLPADDVPLALVTLLDITEKKAAEAALQQSEQHYRALYENSPTAYQSLDENGNVLEVNRTWLEQLGYDREDVVGRWFGDLLEPESQALFRERFPQFKARGIVHGVEFALRRRDGDTLIGLFDGVIQRSPAGEFVRTHCVFTNVTDQHRMERRLRQAEKLEAIGLLAGGVAHDFNNQLAGIVGYADMLRGALDDPKLRRYADCVLIGAQRAADVTRQLLLFARRGPTEKVPFDLHDLIAEVVDLLSHSVDRRIEIRKDLQAETSCLRGDASQIQSALLNLALNARDAMPGGGKLLFQTQTVELAEPATVDLSELSPGEYLLLRVSDTGCGIPAEHLEKVFDPFFTTKEIGQGTGMGLAAVYGALKAHGGAVRVESEPGRGTTFFLYFPAAREASRPSAGTGILPKPPSNARILVIDDEALARSYTSDLLESLGYRVWTEDDGLKGLERFRRQADEIDLVILDMVMPGMDGSETFHAMQTIRPNVRVLIASGYSVNGAAQDLLDQGACGFLQKPYKRSELAAAVAQALACSSGGARAGEHP